MLYQQVSAVGVAVMAMTMTVLTTLKESYVYTIDPSLMMHQNLPLRCEMPLDPKAEITSCCVADVCLTSYVCESHWNKDTQGNVHKNKSLVEREVNAIGKYSISFAGESTGQIVYAITTREALFQTGTLKAHKSAGESAV